MRYLLVLLLLFCTSYAQSDPAMDRNTSLTIPEEPNATEVVQKVLYLNYVDMPERVFKGEIFPVTLKVLSTIGKIDKIQYDFSEARGVDLIVDEPERTTDGRYTYDTFYFVARSQWLQTPHINATIQTGPDGLSDETDLPGIALEVITLNPNRWFANIIAADLNVTDHKTTSYDQDNNILVFTAEAARSALDDFRLEGMDKQGTESIEVGPKLSTMTYYAVIPKRLDEMRFSYFRLGDEQFKQIVLPIIVDDDSVSTQSDLRPTEYKHKLLKITIAAGIALAGLVLLIIYRKLYYLLMLVLPSIYIAYAAVPITYACIKKDAPIYLLPMTNGTVFETTAQQQRLEVEGEIDGYTKVKLENTKIGWIKNEDLCTP